MIAGQLTLMLTSGQLFMSQMARQDADGVLRIMVMSFLKR